MEIVLAVLLLFGGFALGSSTADKGGNDKQSTMNASHVDGVAGADPVTQVMRQSDPTGCHSDKSVIYRDLTVPYRGKAGDLAVQSDDCEGGRDCSYNPTAFPPSAVQGCTNAAIAGRNGAAMEVKCPVE